jgi:hypothetical protein
MNSQQSITSLPESPDADRRRRMINYTVSMSIRMVFVILCFFVDGWWLLVTASGAILMPYVAVVLANNVGPRGATTLVAPGNLQIQAGPTMTASPSTPQWSPTDKGGTR